MVQSSRGSPFARSRPKENNKLLRGVLERQGLKGHSLMKTGTLLTGAVLAIAIGAPIAGFLADMNGQPMTSTGVPIPFLHGFPSAPAAQAQLASFERATAWLNSPPLGEGSYEQSEMIIQRLLSEAGAGGRSDEPAAVDPRGLEVAADWASLKSPENYVGYERTQNFISPGGAVRNEPRSYALPARLRVNDWALAGDWTMKSEATVLNKPNGRIVYRFHARDLHLVMGPSTPGMSVKFRVLLDGKAPGAAHGTDVDERGDGTVTEQRLYQLIRQPKPIVDRQFEIEFLGPGVDAFAFTFG
jgi:Thioredoxin like C-terminal domain